MKKAISMSMAIILCIALSVSLAACNSGSSGSSQSGPSQEKVDKVQNDYAALVDEHNEVVQIFERAMAIGVDLDQGAIDDFNEAGDYVSEFGDIELDDKSDSDLDGYVTDIESYRSELRVLKAQLETLISEQERLNASADEEAMVFIGMVGNDYAIYAIGIAINPDETECAIAFGEPGDAIIAIGDLVDYGDGSYEVYPFEGNYDDVIEMYLEIDDDGDILIWIFDDFEGIVAPASEDDFLELLEMLSGDYDYDYDDDDYYYNDDDYDYDDDDEYYIGVVGDEESIFMVALCFSADGEFAVFGFGNPGSSIVILGQVVAYGDGFVDIVPLDGSEMAELFIADNNDGSLLIQILADYDGELVAMYEGTVEAASYAEFMDVMDMLG